MPGNERYNSNELFKTNFEDKQVTAVAYFWFLCQFLRNKITKLVNDFLNFQSLLESSIIAENFNSTLSADNNATIDEQSLFSNCMQKAEFLLFMLLSSCMYKTETKILIAATHLS